MFDDGSNNVWYDDQGRPHTIGPLANPLPVDVSNLQDYADTLPSPTPNPLPTHWPYVQTTGEKAASLLTGGNGQERYQLFPERIVRSALSLPTDVASGKVQTPVSGGNKVLSSDEDSEDELLQRVQDMAALMGGGGVAMAEKGALGSAGSRQLYRGEYTGNKGGKYWSGDPEFAKQFTQGGRESELLKSSINEDHIYQPKEPVYAGDPDAIDKAVAEARTKGFKAVELSEGQGQPNSVYVFNKTALKSAILKSDNEAAAPIAAIENAPIFHSAVENAVNTASLKTANPEQWLGTISNAKGVKPEELEWTGLKDWLGSHEGQVSKEEIQQYLEGNKVELKEVNKFDNATIQKMPVEDIINYNKAGNAPGAKYEKWQLPGGENYSEKLLTLPSKSKDELPKDWTIRQEPDGYHYVYNTEGEAVSSGATPAKAIDNAHFEIQSNAPRAEGRTTENYRSSHWDEPNILAHIRMNDRTIEGKPALHIEEIQSDWHQQGREQGYKITDKQKQQLEGIENKLTSKLSEADIGNPDMDAVLKTAIEKKVITAQEAANYKQWSKGENSNIPDAPFKKTWLDLAAKRMIREAAEQGKDVLSWTPGEAQAARYDLSKHIKEISHTRNPKTVATGYKGENTYDVAATDHNGSDVNIPNAGKMTERDLENTFGKEIAKKIINDEGVKYRGREFKTLEGLDLKVGGEGMHYFYDKMLPGVLEKLTGQKMKVGNLQAPPKMSAKGEVMPQDGGGWKIQWDDGTFSGGYGNRNNAEVALRLRAKTIENQNNKQPDKINYINLPQHVKDQAMHKGFPLFSSGLMLSPTQDNPFKRYKLTAVDHDPFKEKEK